MPDAAGNSYGPYDLAVPGAEGEPFSEAGWDRVYGHVSGVRSGGDISFSGLTATLTAIDAISHGFWLDTSGLASLWSYASTPTPSGGNPRRDMLVARRQLSTPSVPGKTFLKVLEGTPAASPGDPAYDLENDEPLHSWQVPGNAGTTITGITDLRRWLTRDDSNRATGIVPGGYGQSGSSTGTNGAAEARLTGAQNRDAVTLVPGRAYEVAIIGQASINGAAGLVSVRARARKGATPTTSSAIVAEQTVRCNAVGGTGQVGVNTSDQPFQIAAGTGGSDWRIHLFGLVETGGSSMDFVADRRNLHTLTVKDVGPAPSNLRTI